MISLLHILNEAFSANVEKALANKAKATGISKTVLKQVY